MFKTYAPSNSHGALFNEEYYNHNHAIRPNLQVAGLENCRKYPLAKIG